MSFADRYGPWAVVAGASEGIGRAFAGQIAARGVNLVLVARRQAPLEEVAEAIRGEHEVACITAAIDLAQADSADRLFAAVGDREVGLYVANAGADPHGSSFLDAEVSAWEALVGRNILTALRCCHRFGRMMRTRGRGGLLLVGSGAGYGSGPGLAAYSGVKAFDLAFAEGLWSELEPHGVDVLCLMVTRTDTPALHRLLAAKGLPPPGGLADPEAVAREGLERLPHGPVHNCGVADTEPGFAPMSAATRRDRVRMVAAASRQVLGTDR